MDTQDQDQGFSFPSASFFPSDVPFYLDASGYELPEVDFLRPRHINLDRFVLNIYENDTRPAYERWMNPDNKRNQRFVPYFHYWRSAKTEREVDPFLFIGGLSRFRFSSFKSFNNVDVQNRLNLWPIPFMWPSADEFGLRRRWNTLRYRERVIDLTRGQKLELADLTRMLEAYRIDYECLRFDVREFRPVYIGGAGRQIIFQWDDAFSDARFLSILDYDVEKFLPGFKKYLAAVNLGSEDGPFPDSWPSDLHFRQAASNILGAVLNIHAAMVSANVCAERAKDCLEYVELKGVYEELRQAQEWEYSLKMGPSLSAYWVMFKKIEEFMNFYYSAWLPVQVPRGLREIISMNHYERTHEEVERSWIFDDVVDK